MPVSAPALLTLTSSSVQIPPSSSAGNWRTDSLPGYRSSGRGDAALRLAGITSGSAAAESASAADAGKFRSSLSVGSLPGQRRQSQQQQRMLGSSALACKAGVPVLSPRKKRGTDFKNCVNQTERWGELLRQQSELKESLL
ncbi:hypothetical protein NDU88_000092 [Pleurodeles waltl]|uniref:Uncharacterized protein n=1 Tax=Pleurodeles waltl TaxID=8319 RepID=A0AAV7SW08_PLEWA|nr:hypothetical protein NDU88_000092 [Pleurodeles waltl]